MIKHLQGIVGYGKRCNRQCNRQAVTATSLGATSLIPSVRMLQVLHGIDGQKQQKTTCRTWMDMDGHGTYPIFPFFHFSLNPIVHCNAICRDTANQIHSNPLADPRYFPNSNLRILVVSGRNYGPMGEQTLGIFMIWVIYGSSCIF